MNEPSQIRNITDFPEAEINYWTKKMEIYEGIAFNGVLKETLYTCYISIETNIPLIIVGKPGTGKTLSFNILYNALKGENSKSVIFRDKGKLYRHYYQGNKTKKSKKSPSKNLKLIIFIFNSHFFIMIITTSIFTIIIRTKNFFNKFNKLFRIFISCLEEIPPP